MTDMPKISPETAKLMDEFKSGMWDQFSKALDAKNTETVKNIEEKLHKLQDGLTEVQKAHAAAEKAAKAAEDRVGELEVELAKKGSKTSEADERKSKHYADFFEWMKKGERAEIDFKGLRDHLEVKSTLRTDVDTQGGFLLPTVMDTEIRKNIVEISPVRGFARNRPMASKTMEIPRRSKTPGTTGAPFEGELEEGESGISTYVQEQVTAYRQTWTVPASNDMLISSAFDVEREIVSDVYEHFALGEARSFLLGTGQKGPKGIISDTRCEVVDTASTGVLAFEDFATIIGKLKKGQRPAFFMNRTTLSEVWKLKGSDGHPIWTPIAFGGQTAPTIFGYAYNSDMIHLDSHVPTTSGTKPIIFGDLYRGYEIFDLAGIVAIRDDYTQKKKAIIEWTFHRYLTGQVTIPEAIKIMRVKA